jgi:hypothetical protein
MVSSRKSTEQNFEFILGIESIAVIAELFHALVIGDANVCISTQTEPLPCLSITLCRNAIEPVSGANRGIVETG